MTRRRRQPARAGHHGVEQRVLGFFRAHADEIPDGPVVVAFSGGSDSLALLVALRAVQPALGRSLHVVHVDHALRPGSVHEAGQAIALADAVGGGCVVVRLPDALADRHPGVGLEEAARRERYRELAAVAGAGGFVVTGHHADDQAETVLMHLARGSGLRGAAGIRPVSRLLVPWWDERAATAGTGPMALTVGRPLLGERRTDLRAYLGIRSPDLVPVVDPSNDETDRFRRNAVRAEVLPALERAWPGAIAALGRFASLAGSDDDLLDGMAREALNGIAQGSQALSVPRLLGQHPALARRIVRRWVMDATGLHVSVDRNTAVLGLLGAEGGRSVEVGGGWLVRRLGDLLWVVAPSRQGDDRAVG